MENLSLKITTKTNLFIGNTPKAFEIGGVDLYTQTDYQNHPLIPASSLKGTLRQIVRDLLESSDQDAVEIGKAYKSYLENLNNQNIEQLNRMKGNIEPERIEGMKNRFQKSVSEASAEYLFGIGGFNRTPKLIFNDLTVGEEQKEAEWISIDYKNQIDYDAQNMTISSNPRSYQCVRPGIAFYGEIVFYKMEDLISCSLGHLAEAGIRNFVQKVLLEFNNGIYRLGNSGSRGYGKIHVESVTK